MINSSKFNVGDEVYVTSKFNSQWNSNSLYNSLSVNTVKSCGVVTEVISMSYVSRSTSDTKIDYWYRVRGSGTRVLLPESDLILKKRKFDEFSFEEADKLI